jgi:hypothetical protein
VAAFDVCQGSLADLTIPGLEQSRAAVLTLASAQSRRGHQYAIERFIDSSNRSIHIAGIA